MEIEPLSDFLKNRIGVAGDIWLSSYNAGYTIQKVLILESCIKALEEAIECLKIEAKINKGSEL